MKQSEVNKILDLYHSKDYTNSDAYERSIPPCIPLRSNVWVFLDELEEFNFVRDIIDKDLQSIDKTYRCGEFYTLLIYEKGDFFAEHTDKSSVYSDSEISTSPQDEEKILFTGGYELNRDYKGGNFIIDGKELDVDIGELFYFSRDILHEVKEVKEGIRYSIHFSIEKL